MHETLKPIIRESVKTVGIFTPSMPAHIILELKYRFGIENMRRMGLHVKEGSLTSLRNHEGYRTGTGQQRADEFMQLVLDPSVDLLMANIGGLNSSSMLPYLDYDAIRKSRKLIVGYSDVTTLHMAILKKSGLRTCYGPAVTPSFGEWPQPDETLGYFSKLLTGHSKGRLTPPDLWSNTFRDYRDGSWNTRTREYVKNPGWRTLQSGTAEAPLVIANLSSVLSIAGTEYFPDLSGKILLIEEMEASLSMFERRINQLKLIGAFDLISGLIFSKIEFQDPGSSYSDYERILKEFCFPYKFPILTNFDCGHTTPMLALCQHALMKMELSEETSILTLLEEPILRTNQNE